MVASSTARRCAMRLCLLDHHHRMDLTVLWVRAMSQAHSDETQGIIKVVDGRRMSTPTPMLPR